MNTIRSSKWTTGLVVLVCMSSPAFSQNVSASSSRESTTVHNDKSVFRWSSSTGTTDFNIELRGKVELTDDDQDIKSISDDGYLEINKTVFGSKRSIIIQANGAGQIKKEYYEGRSKMDWEPNGKAWLREILPEVVRSSTIGARSRVDRFFSKGGTPAVLSEIEKLKSDHVKAHYAGLLMDRPVQAKDYAVIIQAVSENIDSDHYMAEFLGKNVGGFIQNDAAASALFSATKELESDHYKTQVILSALKGTLAPAKNVKIILQAAADMESDHYITEVLTSLLKQDNLDDQTLTQVINTTKSIESDHYRTVVLTKAMGKAGLSNNSHQQIIASVKDIESDHYITQVLSDLMRNKLSDEVLTEALDILPSIESDHYRTEVLKMILAKQTLHEDQFEKVLEASGEMGSDHYKSNLLQEALSKAISANLVRLVLKTAREIESDHYKTEVFLAAAPKIKAGSQELKDLYRASAKDISSEMYYGRVLRAIE